MTSGPVRAAIIREQVFFSHTVCIFASVSVYFTDYARTMPNRSKWVGNIDCGYTIEPPRLGGSKEHTQSIFWIKKKIRKNRFTAVYPSFIIL